MANCAVENVALFNLMVDDLRGRVADYDPENAKFSSDKIRNTIMTEILGVESKDDKRFASRSVSRAREVFEYIVEAVDEVYADQFMNNEFYQRYVKYRSLAFGDKLAIRVDNNNYFTVAKYAGNHWDTRRQRAFGTRDITVETEWFNIHVYGEYMDFLTGRLEWGRLMQKVVDSINKDLQYRVNAAFFNAANMLPPEFVVNGTLDAATATDLAERVYTATGSAPVIAGTKQNLSKLTGNIQDAWVSGDMANEKNRTGLLSSWNGYELMTIPNAFQPGTFNFQTMDTLFFLPSNVGQFIHVVSEGASIARTHDNPEDNMDWTLDFNMAYKMAVLIVLGSLYGVYNIA